MRTIKDADQRKHEILDVADRLFAQKGFDGTSTGEILEAAGIARGTLYYHFKSKEDIMDALIERYSCRLLSAAKEIAADQTKPVCQRIVEAVIALKLNQTGGEVIEHIHKPQNALMHQKVQQTMLNGLTPILAGIICEGIAQGLFSTPFPYESMELLVAYAGTVLDGDMVEMGQQERVLRIEALVFNTERLLGVKNGTLLFASQLFDASQEVPHE